VSVLDCDIRHEWATRVWVGRTPPGCDLRDPPVGELEGIGARLLGADRSKLSWRHVVEEYTRERYVALRYGEGAVAVACVLASTGNGQRAESGQLLLHDPRPGAGHVSLPGLPWARPVNIPPEPGMVVAFPAWLAHSVAPLQRDHRTTVWWGWGAL
jgi:hypothetical protein